MENNKKDNKEIIENVIKKINDKDFKIYLFSYDTKGTPKASVAQIYDIALSLKALGYNPVILHEDKTYLENHPKYWLGAEYSDIEHVAIADGGLGVKPEDFVIVPEVFSNIMKQMAEKQFPSKNIVLCQSPDYIFELLQIGHTWGAYGFNDVITTSGKLSEYVKSIFPASKTHEIPVKISNMFRDTDKKKRPLINIACRDQNDVLKITKSFYLKYPIHNWISFAEIRNLTREELADSMSESFLTVWVDDIAGFGTIPLESMKSNTPVIAAIPDNAPEWMVDGEGKIKENGLYVNTINEIPDLIADYVKAFMEDTDLTELQKQMAETVKGYTPKNHIDKTKDVFEGLIQERIKEFETLIKQ